MAHRTTFTCLDCGFNVESWSDGNPYIATPDGKRHYWHHPGEEEQIRKIAGRFIDNPTDEEIRQICRGFSGHESQYICRKCLSLSMLDAKKDALNCSACGATEIVLTEELAGKDCPLCRKGRFDEGRFTAIS